MTKVISITFCKEDTNIIRKRFSGLEDIDYFVGKTVFLAAGDAQMKGKFKNLMIYGYLDIRLLFISS